MSVSLNKENKKRILFFPFNLMSHYLRCIVLAKQYPNDEIFFPYSEKYNDFVSKEGYSTFNVESFDPVKVMKDAAKFDFTWLNEKDIERVFKSQVNALKSLKPDFVIGDTSPTLKMAAEFADVPFTALMNGYMSKYYKNVRCLSITHVSYPFLSWLPTTFKNQIITVAEKISFRQIHKPFKKLRRQYNLKSISNYLNEIEGDENLICDYDFLFPQKELPVNYRIIGPLKYITKSNDNEIISQINPTKKTICVCMGSSGDWEKFQFLSNSKYANYNIIVAGDLQNKIKGNHVISSRFVNLEKIVAHCCILICHGGNGTIYYGIDNKIPILCLTSHFEQEWNVQQLEALKLGACINKKPQKKIDAFLNR